MIDAVPSERLLLLASLHAKAIEEMQQGRPDVMGPFLNDAKMASHVIVAKPLVNLAEELRINSFSVVINSLDKGRPPPGRTWLEWDGAVEGRLPCPLGKVRYDRVGVLVDADETGERGIIHLACRVAPRQTRNSGVAGVLPVSYTYDLRDAWERPPSLMQAMSVQDVRELYEKEADLSPAERDGSPVVVAALSRRFGVVESPYLASAFRKRDGVRTSFWYQRTVESFETVVEESISDVLLTILILLVWRTARVNVLAVDRPMSGKEATHTLDIALLPYVIVDLASSSTARPWPLETL